MDDKRLNELLDQAVGSYLPDPSPLLEGRILQAARSSRAKQRRLPFHAAAACALAAMLTVFVSIRPQVKPEKVHLHWASLETAPTPAPERVLNVRNLVRHRMGKPLLTSARKQMFLAPPPMTQEERALVALVQHSPKSAASAFAELAKRNSDSLEMEPLRIAPLSEQQTTLEGNR